MIEIQEVKTRRQRKQFVEFPLDLYKNNPYFVPPLYSDEMAIFKKTYAYYQQAEAVYYLAYDGKKVVGRISGILQHAANDKWGQKRVRFTRFDSIDDAEVAHALFNAVEEWARSKGMTEVVGPLGFSDLEREGLLIEGFDYLSTFEEQYNYSYYQRLIEDCGYTKDVDWLESRLYRLNDPDDRIKRMTDMLMKRYNLHFDKSRNINEFIKLYADQFFALVDDAYSKLYGTVPMIEDTKKALISNFKLMVDVKFVSVILDENEKVVAIGFALPSISEAVQKSGGRLTIPTLFKLLKAIKHPKRLDLGLIGVAEQYKNRGIALALIYAIGKRMEEFNVEYTETNLTLEDNHAIQNALKSFDATRNHKRRRSFVKQL